MIAVLPQPKLRTIRLYGRLGARFGRRFRLAVDSAAEAVGALSAQIPGFEAWLMASKDQGVGYTVFAGTRNLAESDLAAPVGRDDIRIAPVLVGAKRGGVFQIILGAALIIVATIATGGLAAAFAAGGMWGATASIGLSMMLGGVAQMLAPMPKGGPSDRPENTPNYAFSGPINTQAQGNPVPLLYGRLIIGSAVISAGIEAKDEVYVPTDTATDGGGGGSGGGGGGGSRPMQFEEL